LSVSEDGEGSSSPGDSVKLPLTSYAALGLLSPGEEFTAVEVQERAYELLRYFYWAPALSHIRRELNRLEELGYVLAREVEQGRLKRTLKYSITDAGSAALRDWAEGPEIDPMVVKNSVILRLWLGRRAGHGDLVLRALEAQIAHIESEREDLKLSVEKSESIYRDLMPQLESADDAARTTIMRTAWHLSVMRYCLRSFDQELRNSRRLLRELSELAEYHLPSD
jgi:DNA-binding PadR family transcriptional regulator